MTVWVGFCSDLESSILRAADAAPLDVSEPDGLTGDSVLANGALILRPPRLLFFAGTLSGATTGSSRTGWTSAVRPLAPFQAGRLSRGSGLLRPSCLTRWPKDGELLLERGTWGPVMVVLKPRGSPSGVLDRETANGGSPGASHLLASARESGRGGITFCLSLAAFSLGRTSLAAG